MSTAMSRRGVLAGAVAMPWLVGCSSSPDMPPGVELQDGTFSTRFWVGQEMRWRLAQPARRGAGPQMSWLQARNQKNHALVALKPPN